MSSTSFSSSRTGHSPSHEELEEGQKLLLDYDKLRKIAVGEENVLPVVVQDADSAEVYIIAYANELALQTTLKEGLATFWSTSRNELWIKGKSSGDYLELVEVRVNCEQNALLYLVRSKGKGSCHTKDKQGNARSGCFYRRIKPEGDLEFLQPDE